MNGDSECAIGWNPSMANPAATPTMVCSAIPTLTARRGSCRIARAQQGLADVGQHDGHPLVGFEQVGGRGGERLTHGDHHHSPSGMSATTATGCSA